MNLIVYATTSGATQDVAVRLAEAIGNGNTRLINIWKEPLPIGSNFEWVFAGTPTYGKGDWHYAWMQRHPDVGAILERARRVALFGLGDSIHHAETFAGGIGHLARFCGALGVTTLGRVSEQRPSPSVVDGYFPGLVIEYVQQRRHLDSLLREWLDDIGYATRPLAAASLLST